MPRLQGSGLSLRSFNCSFLVVTLLKSTFSFLVDLTVDVDWMFTPSFITNLDGTTLYSSLQLLN